MKNALFYYYHLYPEFIIKKQGKCIFNLEDLSYQLTPVTRGEEELEEIVSLNAFLSEEKYPKIVLNIFGQPLSFIENHNYILISSPISWHSKIEHWQIDYLFIDQNWFPLLNHSNWYYLWIRKIDYFEYQKDYIKNKYPLLYNSLDYYIGLAENAISYINAKERKSTPLTNQVVLAHRRIKPKMSQEEYNDPFNLILDYKERDQAEYLKSFYFSNELTRERLDAILEEFDRVGVDFERLLARLLFPSYYFDCYERIVNDIEPETSILSYTTRTADYEAFLREIWHKIKKKRNIPFLDWLNKI